MYPDTQRLSQFDKTLLYVRKTFSLLRSTFFSLSPVVQVKTGITHEFNKISIILCLYVILCTYSLTEPSTVFLGKPHKKFFFDKFLQKVKFVYIKNC